MIFVYIDLILKKASKRSDVMDADKIALLIAERTREIATRQENVPFWRGDLRKSIVAELTKKGTATISSNMPYARAVHDGRPAIVIRPQKKSTEIQDWK
jgi:hypothetical protein